MFDSKENGLFISQLDHMHLLKIFSASWLNIHVSFQIGKIAKNILFLKFKLKNIIVIYLNCE